MKAFVIPHHGAKTVEPAEVAKPWIDDDELLVRVHAVGVGAHDAYFLPLGITHPHVIGIEAAGVVEKVGAHVTEYQPGDRIAFVSSMNAKGGTWAEYSALKMNSLIMPIPRSMDFETAAALPVAANTALRVLRALDLLPAGGTLFIAGGSGAIGTMAIQLAKERNWRVAASASRSNHEYMRSLGADLAVDYSDPDWQSQVLAWAPRGVDAAIAVLPGTAVASLPIVADAGQLVPISGDKVSAVRQIRVEEIPYNVDVRKEFTELMLSIATGFMHVEIEQVYPFDDALEALEQVRTRHARGKRVLRLD